MPYYLIHGLVVSLPFTCQGVDGAQAGAKVDVIAVETDVPRHLPAPKVTEQSFDVDHGAFLLRGGMQSARFLVENGNSIKFQKNKDCKEDLFLHNLFYQVMAAVLRQRKMLAFHASSASTNDQAVIVTGDSGAGKSTTISHLVTKGWHLQADDLCAVRLGENGKLEVLPGTKEVCLCEDALEYLPYSTVHLPRRDWHRNKVAISHNAQQQSKPVSRIIYLKRTENTSKVKVERISGQKKLELLLSCLYGPLLPKDIMSVQTSFLYTLSSIDLLLVSRPENRWSMDDVLGAIIGE